MGGGTLARAQTHAVVRLLVWFGRDRRAGQEEGEGGREEGRKRVLMMPPTTLHFITTPPPSKRQPLSSSSSSSSPSFPPNYSIFHVPPPPDTFPQFPRLFFSCFLLPKVDPVITCTSFYTLSSSLSKYFCCFSFTVACLLMLLFHSPFLFFFTFFPTLRKT